jgi:hypothetical protein
MILRTERLIGLIAKPHEPVRELSFLFKVRDKINALKNVTRLLSANPTSGFTKWV